MTPSTRRRHITAALLFVLLFVAPVASSQSTQVKAERADAPDTSVISLAGRVALGSARCLIDNAGAVKCWGSNSNGATGLGTKTGVATTPTQVTGLTSGWTAIGQYGSSTCATSSTGAAKCWGNNWFAQNGNGTTSNTNSPYNGTPDANNATPVDVTGASSGVKDVIPGYSGSCLLNTSGDVKCWGHPWTRGDGETNYANFLLQPPSTPILTGVSQISLSTHNCALQGTTMFCWGYDGESQTGLGTVHTPTQFATGVKQFSIGEYHTCFVSTSGALRCRGANWGGQLGIGTTTAKETSLVTPTGLGSGVASVAAGDGGTCALLTDQTVKCMGAYPGNGSNSSLTPVAVTGLDGPVAVVIKGQSAGTCAILVSEQLQCWGNYPGNGTPNSLTPVTVSAFNSGTAQASLTVSNTSGTYGSALVLTTSGGSGTGAVTYTVTSTGTAGCTLSGSSLSAASAGTCTVTATKDADSTYRSTTSSSTTITFARASRTLTWNPVVAVNSSDSPITFAAASSTGDGSPTYSVVSSTTTSCSVVSASRELTFTGGGTCTVRASFSQTTNYESSTIDKVFTVTNNQTTTTAATTTTTTTTTSTTTSTTSPTSTTTTSTTTPQSTSSSTTTPSTSATTSTVAVSGQSAIPTIPRSTAPAPISGQSSASATTTSIASFDLSANTSTTTSLSDEASITNVLDALGVNKTQVSNITNLVQEKESAALLINNKPVDAKFSTTLTSATISALNAELSIRCFDKNRNEIPLSNDSRFDLREGDIIELRATGFAPRSTIKAAVFSNPTMLGEVVTDYQGFATERWTVPKGLTAGNHTLIATGDLAEAENAIFGLRIVVDEEAFLYRVANSWIMRLLLLLAVVAGLAIPARRRRYQNS